MEKFENTPIKNEVLDAIAELNTDLGYEFHLVLDNDHESGKYSFQVIQKSEDGANREALDIPQTESYINLLNKILKEKNKNCIVKMETYPSIHIVILCPEEEN